MLIIVPAMPALMAQDMPVMNEETDYCTPEDFWRISKVDAHCHINTERPAFMEEALQDNFSIVTINTDAYGSLSVDEQQRLALAQKKMFPDRLAFLATFPMKGWEEADWQEETLARIEDSFHKGAIGIKVWKNIGMVEKDKDGKFIMIDNPKFDSVFNYMVEKGMPVCGHLGEPRNCWLPVDEMTVNNDKSYFKEHPEYHMFLHPDFPSYDDQIMARDNLLQKHPDLHFVGAHLGSLEWSIDELAMRFDRFPNMSADLAARICHLQKQAQDDWQKVREFFILYQDRIIYGTDLGDDGDGDPAALKDYIHGVWMKDWKFFTTDEIMTSREVDGEFRGLKLPREVVEKIYYRNAAKLFLKDEG